MSVYKILLLIGCIQGLLLTLALFIRTYGKVKGNFFFLILLLLISIALLFKLIYSPERYQQFPHIWYIGDTVAFLMAPFWYFTILKSTQSKINMNRNTWLKLSPVLIHLVFLFYIFSLSTEKLLIISQKPWFIYIFYIFCFTVILVNGLFFYQSYALLKQYKKEYFPKLLKTGQYVCLGVLFAWFTAFVVSSFWVDSYQIRIIIYNIAFLSLAFLTFGLAFLALAAPAYFYFLTQTFDYKELYLLEEIVGKIQAQVYDHNVFLQKNYSLHQLAADINTNHVLTSKAINRILKTNFQDFINACRIKHFIFLAQQESSHHLTHWALAQQAGFGNKVSFYNSFKKNYGMTPKQYLKHTSLKS